MGDISLMDIIIFLIIIYSLFGPLFAKKSKSKKPPGIPKEYRPAQTQQHNKTQSQTKQSDSELMRELRDMFGMPEEETTVKPTEELEDEWEEYKTDEMHEQKMHKDVKHQDVKHVNQSYKEYQAEREKLFAKQKAAKEAAKDIDTSYLEKDSLMKDDSLMAADVEDIVTEGYEHDSGYTLTSFGRRIKGVLNDTDTLRDYFLVKEILEKPKALRRRF